MAYVVMDTDVASYMIRGRSLPKSIADALVGHVPCITFVTMAELLKWPVVRAWSGRRRAAMDAWLGKVVVIHSDDLTAHTWGRLAGNAAKRGRPRPQNDMWIAACCIRHNIPLATCNLKDFEDFAHFDGLRILPENRV